MLFEQAQRVMVRRRPEGQLLDCNDAFVAYWATPAGRTDGAAHDNGVYTSTEQRESIRIELEREVTFAT